MAEKFIPEAERAGWVTDNNEAAHIGFFNLRWFNRWAIPTFKNRRRILTEAHAIRKERRQKEELILEGIPAEYGDNTLSA